MNTKKVIVMSAILILLAVLSTAQVQTTATFVNTSCGWVDEGHTQKTPVYEEKSVYYSKNDSTSYYQEFVKYDYTWIEDTSYKCKEQILHKGKYIDYKLQGYKCLTTKTGDNVMCDSCTDGNCDGKCSPNGGETCCTFINNELKCKNSVTSWTERSGSIPVKELR